MDHRLQPPFALVYGSTVCNRLESEVRPRGNGRAIHLDSLRVLILF